MAFRLIPTFFFNFKFLKVKFFKNDYFVSLKAQTAIDKPSLMSRDALHSEECCMKRPLARFQDKEKHQRNSEYTFNIFQFWPRKKPGDRVELGALDWNSLAAIEKPMIHPMIYTK
jgi:hypothetical protein